MEDLAIAVLTADRASKDVVDRQAQIFAASPAAPILNHLPASVVVFNPARQIIFCNGEFRKMLPKESAGQNVLGLRLGEALACLGSVLERGGCGMASAVANPLEKQFSTIAGLDSMAPPTPLPKRYRP